MITNEGCEPMVFAVKGIRDWKPNVLCVVRYESLKISAKRFRQKLDIKIYEIGIHNIYL